MIFILGATGYRGLVCQSGMANPCLGCGACCATFRVSFYWAEAEPFLGGSVDPKLTEKLSPYSVAMLGTNQTEPHCVALAGVIGTNAQCSIYPQRASVCRELEPAWLNNQPSPQCDKARLRHGLPPLTPGWWVDPHGPGDAPTPRAA